MPVLPSPTAPASDADARLRAVLDAAGLATWDWDLTTGAVRYNAALAAIHGIAGGAGEASSMAALPLVHPLDRDAVAGRVAEAQRTRGEFVSEHRIVRGAEHEERWVLSRGVFFYDASGAPRHMSGTTIDVTDRRRAEAALRDSEERHRALVEMSPEGIVVHVGGIIRYANPAALRIAGADDLAGLVGRAVLDFVEPEDRELARERIATAIGEDRQLPLVEMRLRTLRGEPRICEVSSAPVRFAGDVGVQVFMRDVSDRRAAAQALAERERRLRAVFETDVCGVLFWDLRANRMIDVNGFFCRLVGHSREEILSGEWDWRAATPPEFHVIEAARGEQLRRTGSAPPFEKAYLRRDGSRVPVLVAASRLPEGDEAMLFVLDLSERERAAAAWRESETRFQQLAEAIPGVFYLAAADRSRLDYVSPSFDEVWGFPREVLRENPRAWLDHIHPDDRARVRLYLETAGLEYDVEYRIVRPDGGIRWVHDRAFPVHQESSDVPRKAGLAEDVTARVQLEARLRQAEKMEAIGQLAGGIAHDFNNLLTIITNALELARHEIGPRPDAGRELDAIGAAAARAASLTRQLLAYSRKQVLQPKLLDLDETVGEVEVMLRRLIGEHIALAWRPAGQLPRVHLDPGQLAQVLINLVVNARDAMPHGGTVAIHTALRSLDADHATPLGVAPGPYVSLVVRDTGVGMDADTRAHLFEPFFTTKDVGEGTGLGLATVQGIVTQSGGAVTVESAPGTGTTFTVLFPAAAAPAPPAPAAPAPRGGGRETILVVEDDVAVRSLTRRLLERHGYAVLEAGDGSEALELVRGGARALDLVLTDARMPNLGGAELIAVLRRERPELALCLMTGYADDILDAIDPASGIPIIEKPFSAATLLDRVREALGRRAR